MTSLSNYSRLSILALCLCAIASCVPVTTDIIDMMTDTDGTTDTTNLAIFTDPDSEFSTMDVLDIDNQIVRFDAQAKTLIWAEDGSRFEDWEVEGNLLGRGVAGAFQVRFGMVDGVQQAYFTEAGPATICDIEVVDGNFSIAATDTLVPQ